MDTRPHASPALDRSKLDALLCEIDRIALDLDRLNRSPAQIRQAQADAVQRWAQTEMRQGIPEGWVLVPREPTIPMRCAGELTKAPISCWFAMVDAAPPPPEPKPAQEIANCRKCNSFAIQSLDQDGKYSVHCYNEHSSDTFDCDAPEGPKSDSGTDAIRLWNDMQSAPPPAKPELCPHGMPLAENICGPCSQGRPNRKPESAAAKPDEGQSRLRDYEAALRILAAGPHHSLPNDEVAGWSMQVARDALSMPPSPQSSRLEFYAVVMRDMFNQAPPWTVRSVTCTSDKAEAESLAKNWGDDYRVARVTVLDGERSGE